MGLMIAIVIVLIIGAILIFSLANKSGTFSEGANSCEYGGGECVPSSQCTGARISFVCPENQYCCIN